MSATSNRGETNSGSTKSFVTALVGGLIIFGAMMAVFVLFHKKQKKIYQPRTYLAPPDKREQELPTGPLQWFKAIYKQDKRTVLTLNGIDAYSFVRYTAMLLKIFIPTWILSWAVLFPLTAVSPTSGQNGLNIFTFGNVAQSQQARYAGHLIIAWLVTFWIFWLIWTELKHFVQYRHEYMAQPVYAHGHHARTVLVTHLKKDMMDESRLRELATPGQVERVWLIRDVSDVDEVFQDRNDACTQLETATCKSLALAAKRIRKGKASAPAADKKDPEAGESALLNSIITEKKRPTHREGSIPFFGKKVDTMNQSVEDIKENNKKLEEMRADDGQFELSTSAIMRFATQAQAVAFAQDLPKEKRKQVGKIYVDFEPDTIKWDNLGLNSKTLPARKAMSWGLTITLIIFWTIPVAFCGTLSNLSSLCASVSFLSWLCKLPSPVVGIIQGFAPPVALAVLFILLPIVLRIFSTMEGIPLITYIDLSVGSKYWLFLTIHGFLIVTVSSALTSALPAAIQNPSQAPSTLANTLPKASIFFLTYLITTGLSNASMGISRVIPVALYFVKKILGGSTPRNVWNVENSLASNGNIFKDWPNLNLLVILAIVYSVIQPIINVLAVVAFALYWISYKYLFVWVLNQPQWRETNGLWFIKAMNALFVGLYIEELCLIGLFFLASNSSGGRSAIPEGALMIALLVITIAFHCYIKYVWKPQKLDPHRLNNTPVGGGSKLGGSKEMAPAETQDSNGEAPLLHDGQAPGAESTTDDEKYGFLPPSMWQEQPVIWIADDVHGLGRIEAQRIKSAGVEASYEGTHMSEKGEVSAEKPPPDAEEEEYFVQG